jgi:hypothetical protein
MSVESGPRLTTRPASSYDDERGNQLARWTGVVVLSLGAIAQLLMMPADGARISDR